ncbi:MAG TPA: hypothetical protein VHS31_04665 [Tepidisphaeraceae bacterium]|jgi:hypothetical protein|nr:hypothetical protein [Tepidisphaeraceae bacterium]
MGLFRFIAIAGLLLSAIVHVCTLVNFDPQRFTPAMLLHLGVAINFAAAAYSQRAYWTNQTPNKFKGKNPAPYAPSWMQKGFAILLLYGIITLFFLAQFRMHGGQPIETSPGSYALQAHGKTIRSLTPQEYHDYNLYPLRMFSGIWMLGYFAAWMIFESARREAAGAKPYEELA